MLTFEEWWSQQGISRKSKKNESMADRANRTAQWADEGDYPVGVWTSTSLTAAFRPGQEPKFLKWFEGAYGAYGFKIKFTSLPWGPKKISIMIPEAENSDTVVRDLEEHIQRMWSEDIS